jgi:hypothetical protein
VAQGKRSLTERHDADLAETRTGCVRISEVSGPGSEGACRQVREVRAEKPHPKAGGGNTKGRLRCESRNVLLAFMQGERSVGKLAANITRRVKTGAKCQSSGKESVANSHTPPPSGGPKGPREGPKFDTRIRA